MAGFNVLVQTPDIGTPELSRTGVGVGFANAPEDLIRARYIRKCCTHSSPTFAAIGIDEQSSVQSDVFAFFASTGMEQSTGANHVSP